MEKNEWFEEKVRESNLEHIHTELEKNGITDIEIKYRVS